MQWSVFLAFTVASFPADAGESPFMPFPCLSLQDLVIKQQRMEESCPWGAKMRLLNNFAVTLAGLREIQSHPQLEMHIALDSCNCWWGCLAPTGDTPRSACCLAWNQPRFSTIRMIGHKGKLFNYYEVGRRAEDLQGPLQQKLCREELFFLCWAHAASKE